MDETSMPPIRGVGRAILITSIVFSFISAAVVCLRVYVRWFEKSIWWDDGTMFGGLLLYIVSIALACRGVHLGLGHWNESLTDYQRIEAMKYLTIWLMICEACLVMVKSSISITLLRLSSTMPRIRYAIYILIALCCSAFMLSIMGSLLICRPFQANWDFRLLLEGKGECSGTGPIFGISYTSTTITISTDIACAIIPAIILWNTQLKLRTKLMVGLLLSFGSIAAICAVIRTPYVQYFADREILHRIAPLVLWSNIEMAIGLIAGSIPVLQKVILSRFKKHTSGSSPNPLDLVTFGSAPVKDRRRVFTNPTDIGFSITTVHATHPHDWERLEDESGSQGGIRTDFTYEVESMKGSAPRSA
ncbi:hypothetical protein F5Y05DRAFT_381403 [Hypoxylon sp. FL0543]|nr:hypothetical protein F5Y05DRAFT_381403 [Hypoxylon sp. FL0543]